MYENLERCDSVFVLQAKVRISLQTLQINRHSLRKPSSWSLYVHPAKFSGRRG